MYYAPNFLILILQDSYAPKKSGFKQNKALLQHQTFIHKFKVALKIIVKSP